MREAVTPFALQRRARVARRFVPFAFGWAGMLVLWLGVFALEGRVTPGAVAVGGGVLAGLTLAGWATVVLPASPGVLPTAVATCVGLGLAAGWLVYAVGAYGEILAFLLLTLHLSAALVFGWGWRAELTLLAGTLVPWLCVLDRFPAFVPRLELATAVAVGATVALGIAEAIARDMRQVARRRRAQDDALAALAASEERFRSSFDYASVGMVVVGLDGTAVEVNQAFATMLGYPPELLSGRRMDTLAHPDDVAHVTAAMGRLLGGEIPTFEMEKRYLHRDGHIVWGWLSCSLTRDTLGTPRHVIAQVQNISERKAAEIALRASEARYRGLVESQRELVVRLDPEGRFTFVNEAYATAFDQRPAALLGTSFVGLVHPDDHLRVAEMIARMMRPPHRAYVEVRNLMATGVRWIGWEGGVVVGASGQIVEAQAVGRDVTERRAAEEALRASVMELRRSEEKLRLLARRQTAIREEERKRVGFDLHDDVCQELVGVGILIESLRRKVGSVPPEVGAEFDRVVHYVGEVVEHLRLLARELRPFLLRELGLAGSLRALADGAASATLAVRADLETPIPRLDEETEVSVYRIAQEALTNAVRHAGAGTIVIGLAAAAGVLTLSVRDDGRGFDPSARPAAALGLASMEERALALGGRLDLRSAPGTGTTITLRFPLDARRGGRITERAGSSPTRSSSRPSRATTPRAAAPDSRDRNRAG